MMDPASPLMFKIHSQPISGDLVRFWQISKASWSQQLKVIWLLAGVSIMFCISVIESLFRPGHAEDGAFNFRHFILTKVSLCPYSASKS